MIQRKDVKSTSWWTNLTQIFYPLPLISFLYSQRREEQRDKTVYNRVLGREARDKTRTIYVRHLFNQWKQHVIQDRSIVWFVFQGYGRSRKTSCQMPEECSFLCSFSRLSKEIENETHGGCLEHGPKKCQRRELPWNTFLSSFLFFPKHNLSILETTSNKFVFWR